MLRDGVTETAVAVARAEGKGMTRYYAVQLFARPRPPTGCGTPRASAPVR